MAAYLAPRRGLARPQQHGDRAGGRGVIDMDRQKATLVVMRVEHRQLLMAVHHVEGVVDIERHGSGRLVVAAAIQRHHHPHQPDHLAQRGRVLPARHRRLRAQVTSAVRQMAAGQLERGIAAQMVEVVGILVAAGDGEDAGAQDVGKRMHDTCRVARIGDLGGEFLRHTDPPLGQPQQHQAAVGTDAATVEGGGEFLTLHRWQRERQQGIVDHGGCGSVRLGRRLASTPNLSANSGPYATSASESQPCNE